jgi:hypothetical protein
MGGPGSRSSHDEAMVQLKRVNGDSALLDPPPARIDHVRKVPFVAARVRMMRRRLHGWRAPRAAPRLDRRQ